MNANRKKRLEVLERQTAVKDEDVIEIYGHRGPGTWENPYLLAKCDFRPKKNFKSEVEK